MNKIWTAFCGIFFIIFAVTITFTGGPVWYTLSALAGLVSLFYNIVNSLRPNDKKIKTIITVVSAVCFIIIGLAGLVWGGQGITFCGLYIQGIILTTFYILTGILGLVTAALEYFNNGRRRRGRRAKLMNIRLIKTTTNNLPSAN